MPTTRHSRIDRCAVMMLAGVVLVVFAALSGRSYFRSQNSAIPGMSVHEVISKMGEPDEVISVGETINKFGNHPAAPARLETYVYHVFPKSVRRVVIEFENKRVVRAELQRN